VRRRSVGLLQWDFQLRYWQRFGFVPVTIPFTQPDYHVSSFARHCFSNGAPDGVFPTSYNDLLSFKVEGHKSRLRFWNQSIVTMEKTLD
jgi:hypothetical protein